MILFTMIRDDGKEGYTFPTPLNDVNKATEEFIGFCTDQPMAVLGAKTAKIRRVVEMEEITEITLPEPDIKKLCKDALKFMTDL